MNSDYKAEEFVWLNILVFFVASRFIQNIEGLDRGHLRTWCLDTFFSFETLSTHGMVSGATQRYALLCHQSAEMKMLIIFFPEWEMNPQPSRLQSHV